MMHTHAAGFDRLEAHRAARFGLPLELPHHEDVAS